jgi:hypothetical protein
VLELKTISVIEEGCFSGLNWNKVPFAVSVERTFEPIPIFPYFRVVLENGLYRCVRDFYHKGNYETFEILVPGHDRVLFHKGNKEVNSEACVCIAESFTRLDGVTAIGDSKHGFEEFMQLTEGLNEFPMTVSGR